MKIAGLVHGVYFRAGMLDLANQNSVTGWVRNKADGSVEALLEGEERAVRNVVDWARHGPPRARVDSFSAARVAVRRLKGFKIEG